MTRPSNAIGRRLLLALKMQKEGAAMMKQKLRRQHPDASEKEIDALFNRWLLSRRADAPGLAVEWPARARSQQ